VGADLPTALHGIFLISRSANFNNAHRHHRVFLSEGPESLHQEGEMRYRNVLVNLGLLAGLAVGAAGTLSARDWDDAWRGDYQRQDRRHEYRDLKGDQARVYAMRADIARDRARLNEDIRCGREAAAARDAADLARDQRALQAQLRDIRHDQHDLYRDEQSYQRWR
jgi:hypothetical protein